ncbi:hypothetical protein NEMBOFW57_008164 [Staphylotrichum longicolle]|uniref:Redoxin domain-containing protein n=1 Tax=Staphylotrichum longicolle TaxID=669026 RepID=A0AAD4HWX4_9PEZI|nr:hypothetical protein NEMBOFW57_008164 [Staphylotrichum longicolle]
MLLIGVPAAFSPACSSQVPGYIHHRGRPICFFADPTGRFTKMLDMEFDGSALFGGKRSKRYAIIVEQGKVKSIAVEPDNTGVNATLAEKVLGPVRK